MVAAAGAESHGPSRSNVYFNLAAAQPARITIAGAAGNPVRTLAYPGQSVYVQVTWDLRREKGTPVTPGVYLVEVAAGSARESTPLVVRPAVMN